MSDFKDYNNIQVASLPGHLKQLTVVQQYNHYTPVDHAVWRFVMHQNYYYLKDVACYPYLRGLEKAGISPEKIPDLQEMNDALGHVNWGAVTVEGYIPPAMRMEFYAYRVMVVAPTIRKLEHIAYTPTSDIIHEAAGYAALITDDIYRKYLNYLGFISTKAICSAKDFELYDAIRQYEYLKEKPGTPHAELVKAERKVQYCRENPGELSEMALLSRLHWLTVEYGLVGSPEHPQIYGASLLASLSASSACLQPEVKKLPYTLDAIDYPFDSKQAPAQLFVTPDFQHLITVLEQFADTMAFRRGGAASILKAINCRSICTAVYSSGLQVSGVFTDAGLTSNDQLYFIKTSGPTALSVGNRQLQQQEKAIYENGFFSPVGKLQNGLKLEDCDKATLAQMGIALHETAELCFESGLKIKGMVQAMTYHEGKLILLSFHHCSLNEAQNQTLFQSVVTNYHMAVGSEISAVFAGAADPLNVEPENPEVKKQVLLNPVYSERIIELYRLYEQVRICREQQLPVAQLEAVWKRFKKITAKTGFAVCKYWKY